MRDPSELVWLPVLNDDFWWSNEITGIKFEGTITATYSLRPTFAMTDTGTSCTYIPEMYYEPIRKKIIELSADGDEAYIDWYGDLMVDCDYVSSFPTISFLFGGYWMEMLPEDYFVEWQGECFACLGKEDFLDGFLLGDAFLRGYYSTHDHTNKRFGFAPHAESKKKAVY